MRARGNNRIVQRRPVTTAGSQPTVSRRPARPGWRVWTTPRRRVENARGGYGMPPKREAKGRSIEKDLRRQTKRFEPVLEISPTAIVITDPHNRIASWNPAAERLFGYTAKEATGRDLDDLVAATETLHAEADTFRRRGGASEAIPTITPRTRQEGSPLDLELRPAPL